MGPDPNAVYPAEKIFRNMGALCSGDLQKIRCISD